MKPLIGITCNYDHKDEISRTTHMGMPGQDWNYLAADYVRAVEDAGGIPVLIPQCARSKDALNLLERLDGLLISGGHDVNPLLYGDIIRYCGDIIPARDAQDIALAKRAREKKLPVLGICRGIQILAAAYGGALCQDVQKELHSGSHFLDNLPRNCVSHRVKLSSGSRLREIYDSEWIGVNSFHHQSVWKIPENGVVAAHSEDGVIEAVEFHDGNPFFIGVQWHPEMMYDSENHKKLFQALILAAASPAKIF